MNEGLKTILELEEDPEILKKDGWSLVSFYQARQAFAYELAHQKAIKTASEQIQQVGIRSFAYNGVHYYEVWGHA